MNTLSPQVHSITCNSIYSMGFGLFHLFMALSTSSSVNRGISSESGLGFLVLFGGDTVWLLND